MILLNLELFPTILGNFSRKMLTIVYNIIKCIYSNNNCVKIRKEHKDR